MSYIRHESSFAGAAPPLVRHLFWYPAYVPCAEKELKSMLMPPLQEEFFV